MRLWTFFSTDEQIYMRDGYFMSHAKLWHTSAISTKFLVQHETIYTHQRHFISLLTLSPSPDSTLEVAFFLLHRWWRKRPNLSLKYNLTSANAAAIFTIYQENYRGYSRYIDRIEETNESGGDLAMTRGQIDLPCCPTSCWSWLLGLHSLPWHIGILAWRSCGGAG